MAGWFRNKYDWLFRLYGDVPEAGVIYYIYGDLGNRPCRTLVMDYTQICKAYNQIERQKLSAAFNYVVNYTDTLYLKCYILVLQ